MRSVWSKIAGAAAFAVVVGACGSSDSSSPPDTAPDPPVSQQQTTTRADASRPDTTLPVERTASFRGVTADTIHVGALGIDFDVLLELGLVDIDFGDQELAWQTFVDDLNSRGGINGRQLELHYRTYSVLTPESALAACLALTEDIELFAMLNGFNGAAQSVDQCIANDHETILIGDAASTEEMATARAPWIQVGLSGNTRLDLTMIELAHAEGLLDDEVVGVHAIAAAADRIPPVVERLEELGIDVAVETVNDVESDAAEGAALWRVFAERIRSEGVTTLVIVGAGSFEVGQIIDNGLELQILNSDNAVGGLPSFDSHEPSDYDGIVGTFGPTEEEGEGDPGLAACGATFEAATGIEVLPGSEVPEGEPNHAVSVNFACTRVALFEQLATLAGVDLTNDSFRAAIESGRDIDLPGAGFVSFGPDKYDGNDSARLGVLDSTLETVWRPITDLVRLDG